MNTVSVIVETEQSPDLAADPLWRSDRTAAMVPLSWMADAAGYATPAWLEPQLPRVAEMLLALPPSLRWLNMGGWYGVYEFASPIYGGVATPQPHSPKPDRLLAGTAYVARRLRELGVDALAGVYLDNEGQARKANGTVEKNEQAKRMSFLAKCVAPLRVAFPCPVVNFACAHPRTPSKTRGWWGGPLHRGTIDGYTQSVDTYSGRGEPNSEWSVKRANVRECVKAGAVITHGPALYRYESTVYSTPEEAAADTHDGILVDTAVGVRTHFVAAYMWDREHWPLLADTIKRAAASAARLVEDVNA